MSVFDPTAMSAPLAGRAEALAEASDAPAVIAAAYRDGRYAEEAVGVVDRDSLAPAETGQTFEVASQTKLLTAVVVMQLAEEEEIYLDQPIAELLPDSVKGIPNAGTATIRQLLQMRSGIPSYLDARNGNGEVIYVKRLLENPDSDLGPDELLDIARGMEATHEPGQFHYSNTDYLLLGLMIEAVTGRSWATELEQRIFDKVGMTDTTARISDPDPLRLSSYRKQDGEFVDVTHARFRPKGETGVVSTTADMIAFMKALLVDRTLLSDAMYDQMTDFKSSGGSGFAHGLGLWRIRVGDQTVIGRGGGALGTSSGTWYDPATGTIVSMAATTDAASTNANSRSFGAVIAASGAWSRVDEDQPLEVRNVSAADLGARAHHGGMRIAAGEARLDLARELRATDTANTRFDDGSVLVVGDDAAGTAGDDAANDIRIARDYAGALDRDNHLIGLGGDDRLVGGHGDDRIQGGGGHDWLTGSAGNDRMGGSFGDDRLLGGDGDDLMTAGRGRDRLIGGMGRDELYGGAGADVFRFGAGTSARRAADHVGDFDPDRDLIDLRPIDPLPGGRDSALDWIGRAAFSGEAGELRQHRSGDDLRVAADLDGDGRSDFVIVLNDLNGLTKDHFLL